MPNWCAWRSAGLAGPDLHAPADPVQQHIHPGQGVVHAEPAADDLGDPGQCPALILVPALRGRPASSTVSGSPRWTGVSLHRASPTAFNASAARPLAGSVPSVCLITPAYRTRRPPSPGVTPASEDL